LLSFDESDSVAVQGKNRVATKRLRSSAYCI
jgi:hypothetical protein